MVSSLLGSSYGATLSLLIWVGLPLYAALIGLVLAHARPHTTDPEASPEGVQGPRVLLAQLFLAGGALALVAYHRGYEGLFGQGQLSLAAAPARLHGLVWALGALGLGFLAPTLGGATPAPALGVRPALLAPLMLTLWALLPMATHLFTALLLLELVGVVLIWAVTSAPATRGWGASGGPALGLTNGVILFVWASGLSALALLLAASLSGLSSGLTGLAPAGLVAAPHPTWAGALVTVAVSLKFLVGSGQFLLMAWYRYLPSAALGFYLTFYYPAHLLVGVAVVLGLAAAHLQVALAVILGSLGLGLVSLAPHLGAQASPALTLAGSSFAGLALLVVGLMA